MAAAVARAVVFHAAVDPAATPALTLETVAADVAAVPEDAMEDHAGLMVLEKRFTTASTLAVRLPFSHLCLLNQDKMTSIN